MNTEIKDQVAQNVSDAEAAKTPEPQNKKKRRRRIGDRREGRRLRSLDGLHVAMPFIMRDRADACNTFADEIDVGEAELIVREQIQSGKENFSMLHIILAAYVRTVATYPYLNRFVSGQRIYARHNIEVAMTVKKEMTMHAPETCIKVIFDPHDTLFDIYEKFNAAVTNIDNTGTSGRILQFHLYPYYRYL